MTVFVDGEEEEVIEHESFGMIGISRMSGGQRRMFGVDYNTGHSIRLQIKTGEMRRDGFRDWFFENKIIASVEMSEVQFARLISSPNTSGVPCTIHYAATEGFKEMEEPPPHMADEAQMKADVEGLARRTSANMDHICKRLNELAKPGKTASKAEIQEVAGLAQQTQQAMEKDMPYLTARMVEKVSEQVHSAKAEVEAHIQYQLAELGKEALGERIRKGGGVAIRLAGRPVNVKRLTQEKGDAEVEERDD